MSIRICIITRPDLEPPVHGAAVKIMETARALSRLGATVEIVTNDRLWYTHVSGGQVERRRYPQALLSATNCPPVVKRGLARLPVPDYWKALRWLLTRIGYPGDEQFLYQAAVDPDFWVRVLFVGRRYRIQVYQAEFPGYAMPAWIASRLLGGRCALVEHNVEYLRLQDTTEIPGDVIRRFERIESRLARLVDHVIAVSEPDRARLETMGVPANRIRVIPHGVNLDAYDDLSGRGIRARYGIDEDAFLLVFHGTLHYWPNTIAVKHIAEDLLPGLEARGVPAWALVCGLNPPRYYAHPRMVFTGAVQDLPEHLAAADVAVVPLEDGGGTRLKILEYFAARLPVVSTPKGAEGIPVTPGVELELAADMETFAGVVARLRRDPDRAARLSKAGSAFVETLDWDDVCRAYLDCYREPLAPGHTAAYRAPRTAPRAGRAGSPVAEAAETRRGAVDRAQPRAEPRTNRPERANRAAAARRTGLGDPLLLAVEHLPEASRQRIAPVMILNITQACNLSCTFCDQGRGTARMPEPFATRIIDQAARLGASAVVFTGGEPLLHPGLWRMVAHAREAGLGTNVTTNGLLVPDRIDAIVESGLDSISISIDGMASVHDALRGSPGAFETATRALALLQHHDIDVHVHFVVTRRNADHLLAVHDLATSHGAALDFWPVNDVPSLYLRDEASRRTYRDAVEALAAADTGHAARRRFYLTGLDYHAGWNRAVRCLGLIQQFGITVDGRLMPCCVWGHDDLAIGDLEQHDLETLWTGASARAFRKRLVEQGCRKGCYNHSLHEFEKTTGLSFVLDEGE